MYVYYVITRVRGSYHIEWNVMHCGINKWLIMWYVLECITLKENIKKRNYILKYNISWDIIRNIYKTRYRIMNM